MGVQSGILDPATEKSLEGLLGHTAREAALTVDANDKDSLLAMLKDMLLIRYAEEAIADLVLDGTARCPCHLGIGQEAIAVGISQNLKESDRVFGAHRSHSHYLALGGSVDGLFAEVLGKETGCSKGMGGSMHLRSLEHGFYGSVPIVGATIPIAVGAGLAAKLDGGTDVAVSYFGDGACEEGVFHESMNLASTHKLPVLFVVENNLYSSHMDILWRQPSDMVSRFAIAHSVPARLVDGNDVLAMKHATADLLSAVRQGEGPAFIEAVTYRWRGHVGPDENVDVGLRRKAEDLQKWKKRDPVRRLYEGLLNCKAIGESDYESMQAEVRNRVAEAVTRAKEAPYPPDSALLDRVYTG